MDAQVSARGKIYSETRSGAKTDRAALSRVLAALDAGDVLMVNKAGPAR